MSNVKETNETIQANIQANYDKIPGVRVGDYIELLDLSLVRVAHLWEDFDEVQYTDGRFGASFYIDDSSSASFSGGLQPPIKLSSLRDTGEVKLGSYWFFSNNEVKAHNGVHTNMFFRVYKQLAEGTVFTDN